LAAADLTTHMFTNALTIAKQAIQSGRVIGIYTKIGFLEEIAAKELVFVPFAIKSLKEYRIGLIVSASVSVDPVRRVFSNTVESVFKSLEFGG